MDLTQIVIVCSSFGLGFVTALLAVLSEVRRTRED